MIKKFTYCSLIKIDEGHKAPAFYTTASFVLYKTITGSYAAQRCFFTSFFPPNVLNYKRNLFAACCGPLLLLNSYNKHQARQFKRIMN